MPDPAIGDHFTDTATDTVLVYQGTHMGFLKFYTLAQVEEGETGPHHMLVRQEVFDARFVAVSS